jgi:DNA-binding transcriptional ArsR family regulator
MNRTQLTALLNDGSDRQLSTDQIVDEILALAEGDSTWAKALSHPLRGNILRLMRREGSLSPIAVSRETGQSVGTIAYHFRQLHKLGYIEVCDELQRRGATEHVYRLTQASGVTAENTAGGHRAGGIAAETTARRTSRPRGDQR